MPIFQGRTCRLKSGFINEAFLPATSNSILTSVQVNVPQVSNTPIKQVTQRALAGNYQYIELTANVEFNWLTSYTEGLLRFHRVLQHFREKSGGIVKNPIITQNMFGYLEGSSLRISGLNPIQFSMSLTFLNCSDILSTAFDPLEFFGITNDESESVITITENLNSAHLVTERNYSLSQRADFSYGLDGYRDLKFGEVMLSESITSIDSGYIPDWQFSAYVYPDTTVDQHVRSSSESGPRIYTTSRQAQVIPLDPNINEVSLGW
jgi:hypothetical protein